MTDFQPGQRIRLVHTTDPHTRLRPGDTGTVRRYHPAAQTVDIAWDSGSHLSMCLDAGDRIEPVPAAPSPITQAVPSTNVSTRQWDDILRSLRTAGTDAGRVAAESWYQHTVAGHAGGDVRVAARRILADIDDGDIDVLEALPHNDETNEMAVAGHFRHISGDGDPDWVQLNNAARDEAIDAYRERFNDAVEDRATELCRLATSPTGTDLGHLRPDTVRLGHVGVFAGDWAWTDTADGNRIPVGFVGTLIDRWNGWAVFSCTRPVAEAIVADQQRQRDEHHSSLQAQGVAEQDIDAEVDEAMARLAFDGDDIVADQRVMYDDPEAVERFSPDGDGRYVVMGYNWCWTAVDPYACDRLAGDVPPPGQEQEFVLLGHTPGMRVPHDRLTLTGLRHRPTPHGLAFTATLTLDGERVGVVSNDRDGDGTQVFSTHPRFGDDGMRQYLAGCRYRGAPISEQRLLDALVDEQVFAQAIVQAKEDFAGTQLRLVDDDGRTHTLRPITPVPDSWEALQQLGRDLADEPRSPGMHWQVWTGTGWYALPDSHSAT
jgi:hypothetical protein